MAPSYDPSFYRSAGAHTPQSAAEIVPIVLEFVSPTSVADIGCGSGAWLAEFSRRGFADVMGFDGPWVEAASLQIPADRFQVVDLSKPLQSGRRFDLAVCLEVAEHLPGAAADALVESLTRLSDLVLFSAAIPFQGGMNHVNEQWPDYWAERFARHDYVFADVVRPRIWNNPRVEWWYAQNIFLVAKRTALPEWPLLSAGVAATRQLSMVHPRAYVENAARAKTPFELMNATLGAIKRRLLR